MQKLLVKKVGGWWVVNKANGHFKYVPASGLNLDDEIKKIEDTVATVNTNKFERCFFLSAAKNLPLVSIIIPLFSIKSGV